VKHLKRLASALLCGTLLFSTVSTAAAATEQDANTLSEIYNNVTEPLASYNADQVAPFSAFFGNRQEEIAPGNGNLRITETDLQLPGRNGMDLRLSRIYSSQTAAEYRMGTRVDYSTYWGTMPESTQWLPIYYRGYTDYWTSSGVCFDMNGCWVRSYSSGTRSGYFEYNAADGKPIRYVHSVPSWSRGADRYVEEGGYYTQYSSEYVDPYTTSGLVKVPAHQELLKDYYLVDERYSDTHLDRRHGLGVGWQWDFPTLELRTGGSGTTDITYHNGGSALVVDWKSASHFKDQPLKDQMFDKDSGTFSNTQKTSAYKVTTKDGHVSYFGDDGRLLGMKDRLGNTITFKHTTWKNQPVISQIIDTVGRTVGFSYTDTQVKVTAPGNRVWTYNLAPLATGKYKLTSVVDPLARSTQYAYTEGEAAFSFLTKSTTNRTQKNVYLNLTHVTYPTNGIAQYTYQKVNDNLGKDGTREVFKIQSRKDLVGGVERSAAVYTYNGEPGGFGKHSDPAALPSTYVYTGTVTHADGTSVAVTYDYRHLLVRRETKGTGVHQVVETTYDATLKLPVQEKTTYEPTAAQPRVTTSIMKFNEFKDLLESVDIQGAKTTFTYDPTFHQMTSVSAQQNSTGTLTRSEFQIDPASGVIKAERYYYTEAGQPKTILVTHEYDAYGNRTKTRRALAEDSSSYREIAYEYDAQYNGAYVTRQTESYWNAAGQVREASSTSAYDFSTGALISFTDPLGATSTTAYDLLQRPTLVTYPAVNGVSASKQFAYDDSTLCTDVTDENGHRTRHCYDQLGQFLSTTRSLNGVAHKVAERAYDSVGRVAYQIDANGNRTSFQYDGLARVTEVTLPDLTRTTTVYDDRLMRSTETNANLNSATTVKDPMGRIVEVLMKPYENGTAVNTTRSTYDYFGNVLAVTDARGNTTSYGYDERNRTIRIVDAENHEYQYRYDFDSNKLLEQGPQGRSTRYVYDTAGRLIRQIDALGGVRTNAYDAKGRLTASTDERGNVTRFEYDARDRLIQQVDPTGNATVSAYDPVGNVTARTDARGNTMTYQYDEWNRLVRLTNAVSETQEMAYDPNGNMVRLVDAAGNATEYVYNFRNQVTQVTMLAGTSKAFVAQTATYDSVGNRIRETDALGKVSTYLYDGLNRVVRKERPVGTDVAVEETVFDAVGNVILSRDARGNETRYEYNKVNHFTAVEDANGNRWTYELDPFGSVTSARNPRGAVTRFEYDALGRKIAVTDELNYRTQITYDAAGNVTHVATNNLVERAASLMSEDTDGDGVATDWRVYHWSNADDTAAVTLGIEDDAQKVTVSGHGPGADTHVYDYVAGLSLGATAPTRWPAQAGDVLSASVDYRQAGGDFSQFLLAFYDASGKVVGTQYSDRFPAATSWTRHAFQFQAAPPNTASVGISVLFRTTGRNAVSTATGSAWFRLLQVDKGGPTSGPKSFQYDSLNRVTAALAAGSTVTYTYDPSGNRSQMVDATGTTQYQYDAMNRLTKVTVPNGKSMQYRYNPQGVVDRLTDYAGKTTDYAYDELGRVTSVTREGDLVATMAYDRVGRRTNLTLANGLQSTSMYDDLGRLAQLTAVDTAGSTVASMQYGYDKAGNMTSRIENGTATTYQYSALNQLTRVTQANGSYAGYTYDAAGNRISAFNSATNTTDEYTYDLANRLATMIVAGETTQYSWNAEGSLLSDGTSQYAYDGLNRLARFDREDSEVTYGYNGDGLLARRTADGTATRYYYAGQHVVNEGDDSGAITASMVRGAGTYLAREGADGAPSYYLYNGHGDVTAVTDASGAALATYQYDAFGNLLDTTGHADNPYLYSGEYFDAATELYYLRTRFYSPKVARFITSDSYQGRHGDPMSLNLYTYVRNNPMTLIDPTGLADSVVVMIHGILADSHTFDKMADYITSHDDSFNDFGELFIKNDSAVIITQDQLDQIKNTPGNVIVRLTYENRVNRLETDTAYLYALLHSLSKKADVKHFDLIGHSAGGLIARNYLQTYYNYPDVDFTVHRLITLGSPHMGAGVAHMRWLSERFMGPLPMFEDLRKDSQFLARLNEGKLPLDLMMLVLAGSSDAVVDETSALSQDENGKSTLKREGDLGDLYIASLYNPIITHVYHATHSTNGFEDILSFGNPPAIYHHPAVLETVLRFLTADTTEGFVPSKPTTERK
jgi:RHS repeat-associated protein